MKEIEHEDEIGQAVTWRATWDCKLCGYRNDAADRDGINAHETAHRWADREAANEEGGSGATGGVHEGGAGVGAEHQ